jgi:hypothetical protein
MFRTSFEGKDFETTDLGVSDWVATDFGATDSCSPRVLKEEILKQ